MEVWKLKEEWRFSDEMRCEGSITKGGVKKDKVSICKVPHCLTLINCVYVIGF